MCFGPKIMSNDQAVILLDDIAIIFHFDESRLSVLMCYLFDPLIIILTQGIIVSFTYH